METSEITEEQWESAYALLRKMRLMYADLPGNVGLLALVTVFAPLFKRYESGERTPELYEAMRGVK